MTKGKSSKGTVKTTDGAGKRGGQTNKPTGNPGPKGRG